MFFGGHGVVAFFGVCIHIFLSTFIIINIIIKIFKVVLLV